jgi:hypothetical protein
MNRIIVASVGDETEAIGSSQSAALPSRDVPATEMPTLRRAARNAIAAESAGFRVV